MEGEADALRETLRACVKVAKDAHAAYVSLAKNEGLSPTSRAAVVASFATVDWRQVGIEPEPVVLPEKRDGLDYDPRE